MKTNRKRVARLGLVVLASLLEQPGPLAAQVTPASQQPGRVAYVRSSADPESPPFSQVWVMNDDGSRPRRLSDAALLFATAPAFSRDGRSIALSVLIQATDDFPAIFAMNADGTGLTLLTYEGSGPAWAPEGERLAFRNEDGNICVLHAGNPEPVNLTEHPAYDYDPAWSPDGARIAFVSDRDGNPEIYVMNSDGSAVMRLTNHPAPDLAPDWSPDGTRIAFASERDGNAEIYVMNADGTGVTRITDNPAGDETPTWSPDGARIAFASRRDGNWEIYVMNADGSAVTRLTRTPDHHEGDPAWGAAAPATAVAAPRPMVATPAPAPGVVLLPPRYDPTVPIPVVIILPFTYGSAAALLQEYGGGILGVSEGYRQLGFEALLDRLLPDGGPSGRGFAAILVRGAGDPTDYITGEVWSRTIRQYEQQALADLAAFTSRHRVDSTRVVLAGFSMGGDLAWALALRNPSRFRGAIVMGSRASYRARPADHRALAERGMRFYFAIGRAEEDVRLAGARAAARFLEQLGVQHRYREIPAGHGPAPPTVFAEALAFMLQPTGATTGPSVRSESIARWVETGGPPGMISAFALSEMHLFVGSDSGVFLSTDAGTRWTALNTGLPRRFPVRALVVSGTHLFAGTGDGAFRSTNNGATWSSAGLWRDLVRALAVSGTSIFAGTPGGVFRSTNNGTTWTEVNTGLPRRPSVFALAVSGTDLFVGTLEGVFRSTNNGASWFAAGLGGHVVRALAVSGTGIFAAGEYGVFHSSDNGASWAAAGLERDVVRALATSGTHLFAGSQRGGVFLSTNNGASWTVAGPGLEDGGVSALAVSGTHLFAGTFRRGVWRLPSSETRPPPLR